MNITVIGMGYVGLSNAILLAQNHKVIGVDISEQRVKYINDKKSYIKDKEISEYLRNKKLDLEATTDLQSAINNADYVIVSTPTNYNEETKEFDTSSVYKVIFEVLKNNNDACVVIKSTIPVGFVRKIRNYFKTDNIFFSPEFLREGSALYDNLFPSRIIVGDNTEKAKKFAEIVSACALKDNIKIIHTGPDEAEAIKLFANSYLALRVAYFNEIDSYAICRNLSTRDIIDGVCMDERIGNHYNNPSFGYGGYCLPKDTKQLLANYEKTPQKIISAIVEANDVRKKFLASEILKLKADNIGIFRLSMKSGSDNFRESSILQIIDILKNNNKELLLYEPELDCEFFEGVKVISNLNEFKKICDVIITNRYDVLLDDVEGKIFTRDIYLNN